MIKDAYFPAIGSTAFGVDRLAIKQAIEVILSTDHAGDWFFNNDAVLDIQVSTTPQGSQATIKAIGEGVSKILFMSSDGVVVDNIQIEVTSEQAASLGLKAGSPEPKTT